MKFFLEERHWGDFIPDVWEPKLKGRAIDACLREFTDSKSYEKESYDLEMHIPNTNIWYHEFKSTSTGSISISRMEFDFAHRKYYRERKDTLYWVCSQGDNRDSFNLEYFIRFSLLDYRDKFLPSKQKEGDVYFWMNACREMQYRELLIDRDLKSDLGYSRIGLNNI